MPASSSHLLCAQRLPTIGTLLSNLLALCFLVSKLILSVIPSNSVGWFLSVDVKVLPIGSIAGTYCLRFILFVLMF